jgi:heme/copper-type cytochrome/quinol oxidase subunit 2
MKDMSVVVAGKGGALCFACPGPDVVVPIVHHPKTAPKTAAPSWIKKNLVVVLAVGVPILLVVLVLSVYCIRKHCRTKNAYYDRRYSQIDPNRGSDVSFDNKDGI